MTPRQLTLPPMEVDMNLEPGSKRVRPSNAEKSSMQVRLRACASACTQLNSDCCLALPDGTRIPFIKHGIHYAIQPCEGESESALAVINDTISADLWHARLGHFGIARVHRTLADHKIDALKGFDSRNCAACLSVKRRKGRLPPA
eukprot:scaffold35793_cov124-Isochrysis_galbana.AAC.3